MIECDHQQLITCPYCGWQYDDSWEADLDDGEWAEMECGNCEKMFKYRVNIEVTYSSFKKEKK